jgi:hypothetical protein
VVPVQVLDLPNLRALAYAASLRQPTLALHVSPDEEEAEAFLREWRAFGDHLPLEIISSPYRAIVPPLAHYLRALHSQRPDLTITVVFSELVVERAWQRALHDRTARRIGAALREQPNTIITAVPFHVGGLSPLVVGPADVAGQPNGRPRDGEQRHDRKRPSDHVGHKRLEDHDGDRPGHADEDREKECGDG